MSCSKKERVEAMVASFEEQVKIAHPVVPNYFHNADTDSNDTDEAKEDSILRDSMKAVIDELPYPSDFDSFKTAITMVVHKWKSEKDKNATNEGSAKSEKTSKSFSLFDQLQGGFTMPVTLEDIEEAESGQQRLVVFQKIKYLEDLFMDWNKICPLLRNDLSESFLADPSLCLKLIDLHRKWFDQGRSSSEYTSLLFGLCENMLFILTKIVSLEEKVPIEDASHAQQKTIVVSLVQNWRDMWLDLMQRDQYSEDLAHQMETLIFELFWGSRSCQATLLAKRVLASIDPSARWFQSWAHHVSTNDRLLSLLCGVLPALWGQLQSISGNRADRKEGDILFNFHSAAILSIMLSQTRVSQFPWHSLTSDNTETTKGDNNAVDEMLDLFLQSVLILSNHIESSKAESTIHIILNAGIEAILAGTDNDAEFDRRFREVESRLQGNNVDQFLKTLLKQRRTLK